MGKIIRLTDKEKRLVKKIWPDIQNGYYQDAFDYICDYITYKQPPEAGLLTLDIINFLKANNIDLMHLIVDIGRDAFSKTDELVKIEIPNNIKTISSGAFESCYNLSEVVIPDSIRTIEFGAFFNCSALKEIKYLRTKEQWNSIWKHETWKEYSSISIVHCIDGDVNV